MGEDGEAEVAAPPPEPELPPTGNGVAMRILSAAGAKWLPLAQASAGRAWQMPLATSLDAFSLDEQGPECVSRKWIVADIARHVIGCHLHGE
jgi:hypothetical protein